MKKCILVLLSSLVISASAQSPDKLTGPYLGQKLPVTASIKGATMVVAEKSGHMIPFSQPDLLVSVVSEVVRLAK